MLCFPLNAHVKINKHSCVVKRKTEEEGQILLFLVNLSRIVGVIIWSAVVGGYKLIHWCVFNLLLCAVISEEAWRVIIL